MRRIHSVKSEPALVSGIGTEPLSRYAGKLVSSRNKSGRFSSHRRNSNLSLTFRASRLAQEDKASEVWRRDRRPALKNVLHGDSASTGAHQWSRLCGISPSGVGSKVRYVPALDLPLRDARTICSS